MILEKFYSVGIAVSDDLRTASAAMDPDLYKLIAETNAQVSIVVQDVEIIIKAKKDCGKCLTQNQSSTN